MLVTCTPVDAAPRAPGIIRDAEVAGPRLTWPADISAAVQAAPLNALAAQGIIVR